MNREQTISQLEREVAESSNAEKAYTSYIRPFIDEKRKVLFEAFMTISVEEPNKLMEIKRQQMVLEALNSEVVSKINTGKLARQQLEEMENDNG